MCADAANTLTLDGMKVIATPFAAKTDFGGAKGLCTNVSMTSTTSGSKDYNGFDFKVQLPSGEVPT